MQKNYRTKQKNIISECLLGLEDKAVSADEIEYILKEQGNPVGKATIYRYLLKLEAEGVVRKIAAPDKKCALFQMIRNNCHTHLHLRCEKCGKTVHLECDFMKELDNHIKSHHGFFADYNSSTIYGVCAACKEAI